MIIQKLSEFFPVKALCHMYKTLVRSHLDYCDIIYHIPSTCSQTGLALSGLMVQLENIQYQTALRITGTWKGTNRTKIYEELGWESLSDRRWCRRILQIHKIVSDKTPLYLKEKLPHLRNPLYNQTYFKTFFEIRCRSQRYKNSFFPDAISSWNNITSDFNAMPTFDHLSIFGIHDTKGVKYLF